MLKLPGFVGSFGLPRGLRFGGGRGPTARHPGAVHRHLRPGRGESGAADAGAGDSHRFWPQILDVSTGTGMGENKSEN